MPYFCSEMPERSLHRTRIAPTPSGYLHLGNIWSFLLTVDLARKEDIPVMLRIDDLDQERVRPAYLEDIFDSLHWLGISWNEGPSDGRELASRWSQLHRLDLYRAALQELAASGRVFACTCSRAAVLRDNPDGIYRGHCLHHDIPLDQPGVSWRLRTDLAAPVRVQHYQGTATVHTLPPSMDYFVVRRRDGLPAYQLSSLVDDLHFGVDLVVRGRDLWESTLAQLCVADMLGDDRFVNSRFFHHELLPAADGRKLSKSAGDTSIRFLRQAGMDPETVKKMLPPLPETPWLP